MKSPKPRSLFDLMLSDVLSLVVYDTIVSEIRNFCHQKNKNRGKVIAAGSTPSHRKIYVRED